MLELKLLKLLTSLSYRLVKFSLGLMDWRIRQIAKEYNASYTATEMALHSARQSVQMLTADLENHGKVCTDKRLKLQGAENSLLNLQDDLEGFINVTN
jgi:hypothetical protein